MRAQETSSWDDLEASLGFGVGLLFGTFLGSLSDLLGRGLTIHPAFPTLSILQVRMQSGR